MILDAEKVFGTDEIVDMQNLTKDAGKSAIDEVKE
jgi:hypothetical protein